MKVAHYPLSLEFGRKPYYAHEWRTVRVSLEHEDEQYAEQFVARIEKDRQAAHAANQQSLIDHKLKEQQAPIQWHELRSSLKRRVELINCKLDSPVLQWHGHRNFHAEIVPIAQQTVKVLVVFNESNFVIEATGEGPNFHLFYAPEVSNGKFCYTQAGKPVTIEEIAKFLLDALKEFVR